MTIEGLKNYRVSNRRYRNRRIGDFLKELHLIEGRNTGFKKIIDALEANGSPKPEFETDDERTYFIARMFIQPEFQEEIEDGEKTTPKTTPKINGLEQEELQDKIINCIIENPNISKKAILLGMVIITDIV